MTSSPMIPYVDLVAQHAPLKGEILAAVGRVLDHGQFILGPEVAELERRLADWLGVSEIVGVANGTDALVLALRLAGVGPGDEVITVSHSFVATASAIALVGATPVFIDIDERTMLMDPGLLRAAITPRTRAVLPVHLSGAACDLDAIAEICRECGLELIEDCAQAIGARSRQRGVGTLGIGCFSLHPLKILGATGDAGFIAVSDAVRGARLRTMRNLGLVDRDHCTMIASNSRLDALQAAILLAKLPYLDGWIAARRGHAAAYRQRLARRVTLPHDDPGAVHSAFVIRVPRRDGLLAHLRERGIDARVHYPIPIHRQAAYAAGPSVALPVTDRVVSEIISLPCSPELTTAQRERVVDAVLEWS